MCLLQINGALFYNLSNRNRNGNELEVRMYLRESNGCKGNVMLGNDTLSANW